MKKVIVIGCPGAGKSTFARKLAARTGLPLYHLDNIWHLPDRTNVSRAEFDHKLVEIMERDEWIIDGNYLRTLPCRLEKCDTVFFFDLPVDKCIQGITERVGKECSDMPWIGNNLDEDLRRVVEDFPQTQSPLIHQLLDSMAGDKILVTFNTRAEADSFLDK